MFRLPTTSQTIDTDQDGSLDGGGGQGAETHRLQFIRDRVAANQAIYRQNGEQFRRAKRNQRQVQQGGQSSIAPGMDEEVGGFIPLAEEPVAVGGSVFPAGSKQKKKEDRRKRRYWETWEPSTSSQAGSAGQQTLPSPGGGRPAAVHSGNLVTTSDEE